MTSDNPRILIVDDDESTRRMLSLILARKGYETETAGTGQEATEKFRERFFNVALLDIRLPDVGGVEVLTLLKGMHPDTMVIMATAHASVETATRALNEGASAYITKPLDMDELLAKVRDVLEKQHLIAENQRLYRETQRRAGQLALLNEIGRLMVSSLDRETVLRTAMQQVIEVLRVEAASALLLDRDSGELVFQAAYGEGVAGLIGYRLLPGQGIAGWVAEHGRSLIVSDVRADDRFYPEIDADSKFTTRSILCVPLTYNDQTIGVMQALNKIDGPFEANDRHLLETLASTAVIAIENARLYEVLQEERGSLARRVTERTAELSLANAELARASRLKDEFLASMSHELRTPLNAVLGLSEALQGQVYGPLNEKQLQSLCVIEDSGRHLLSLINDILDVARIEAGKMELEVRPVSIESVCQASLVLVKQAAHKKRLKVSSILDSTVTTLRADERRLKQMLVNLLSNAVKFTPQGGEIGLEVVGDAAGKVVHFAIWDTGIGMSEESMARLFQPFVQLDSSLSREYEGTGLGLALVRRLAEMHGGGISVESDEGEGSRFTVSLPWQPADERRRVTGEWLEDAETGWELATTSDQSAGTILLAEDNESNIDTIREYLLAKGYRVTVARNGIEAIERARDERPDVVLMDIQMPRIPDRVIITEANGRRVTTTASCGHADHNRLSRWRSHCPLNFRDDHTTRAQDGWAGSNPSPPGGHRSVDRAQDKSGRRAHHCSDGVGYAR